MNKKRIKHNCFFCLLEIQSTNIAKQIDICVIWTCILTLSHSYRPNLPIFTKNQNQNIYDTCKQNIGI